jgi:hypothetical protein
MINTVKVLFFVAVFIAVAAATGYVVINLLEAVTSSKSHTHLQAKEGNTLSQAHS